MRDERATDLADAVALCAIGLCVLDKVRVAQIQREVLEASTFLQDAPHNKSHYTCVVRTLT